MNAVDIKKKCDISTPGSIDTKQAHTFQIYASAEDPDNNLEDENFQLKHAKALYNFLFSVLPAGIWEKFVLLILKGDIGCNNYIANKLKISKKEIRLKYNGVLHD